MIVRGRLTLTDVMKTWTEVRAEVIFRAKVNCLSLVDELKTAIGRLILAVKIVIGVFKSSHRNITRRPKTSNLTDQSAQ